MISPLAQAKKYYTLTNGNWNNTSNVWSLNNTTPCGCFPGYNIAIDTLYINHPVSLTGTVNSSANGRINVNSAGSIASSVSDIFINNSVLIAFGSVTVRSLNVGTGGNLSIKNTSVIVNLNFDNYGSTIIDNSAMNFMNGNINNWSGGNIQLINTSYLQSLTGNFKNSGILNVCSTCCISLYKGNFTNSSGALVSGSGALISSNGNIKNTGNWNSSIVYCTSGVDQGLNYPENCTGANQICLLANGPLPTELLRFEGKEIDEINQLSWDVGSERAMEYYRMERSDNGNEWIEIAKIYTDDASTDVRNYFLEDKSFDKPLNYYRLSKVNENQQELFSRTISINRSGQEDVIVFPNPTNGNIYVKTKDNALSSKLILFNSMGMKISETELPVNQITEVVLPYEAGQYFLQLFGSLGSIHVTVIKY